MTKRKKTNAQTAYHSPVQLLPGRAIGKKKEILLYVRAGGRCEFHGCNKYLFRHHLAHEENNFSEKAHLVAYSEDGPRGSLEERPADIHDLDNLMLLCAFCHKEIDNNPELYAVKILRQFKRDHEDRIFRLSEIKPDHKTKVIRVVSRIGGQKVVIPVADIKEAVFPRYPQDPKGVEIDLSDIPDDGKDSGAAFYALAMQAIAERISLLYQRGIDTDTVEHISVFALAPIPLLIFLGSQFSNSVAIDPYQRHRDTEKWAWETQGEPVIYKFLPLRSGKNTYKVALIMSLSGKIRVETLPSEIDESFSVYEITLENQIPTPTFLRTKQNLDDFRQVYQQALRFISSEHMRPKELHVFPAVPAPVAVLCGRELMPKIDPVLLVYDDDRKQGGFKLKVRVNER